METVSLADLRARANDIKAAKLEDERKREAARVSEAKTRKRNAVIKAFANLDQCVAHITNEDIAEAIEAGRTWVESYAVTKETIETLSYDPIDDPSQTQHTDPERTYVRGYKWIGVEISCLLFDRLKELNAAGFYATIDAGQNRREVGTDGDGYPRYEYWESSPCIKVRW